MEKIKDLTKVILLPDYILGEVVEPKRLIVLPEGGESNDLFIRIIVVGPNVTDLKAGDIVINTTSNFYGYKRKNADGTETKLAIFPRGMATISVTPDNFIDPDRLVSSVTI